MRHGRGFGVHSPLAYELITSVLPDNPAYYGDATINKLYDNRRQRRIGRIILRLLARFEPESVYCQPRYSAVVPLAGSKIKMVEQPEDAQMTICDEEGYLTVTIGAPVAGHGPLTLDNESDLRITIYRAGLSPTTINSTL